MLSSSQMTGTQGVGRPAGDAGVRSRHWSVSYAGGRLITRAILSVYLCDWEMCLEPGGPGGCGLGALPSGGLLVNPKGQLPEGICYQL